MTTPQVTRGNINCSVPGCTNPHRARGLCNTHYHYFRRHNALPDRLYALVCSVDGCDGELEARGLCQLHYGRWRKTGSIADPQRPSAQDRFWAKVDKGSMRECWQWLGSHGQAGHGTFWDGSKPEAAHRYAYRILIGPIPEGMTIDHLCRNPACVNPAHMECVTLVENILRSTGVSAINAKKTHCPQGHPYDEANTYVDNRGARTCIICRNAASRRSYTRKKNR